MGKRSAPWVLLGACMVAALFASVGTGLLMAATRGARSAAGKPAKSAVQQKPLAPAPAQPSASSELTISAPEQGATLRGTALVRADYPNPMGYVMFRIDDQFAYATTPPFEMKWDTTSALDGQHVISADAYDASARYVGSASISVVVENAIPTPPDGVLLTIRFDEHDVLTRGITARGELSALQADEALPTGFDVLAGDLRAEVTTSVMDTFYEGATTLVRSRLRSGTLTAGGRRSSVSEVGQYEMLQVSRNGLTVPVAAVTAKPRLGLAEMSFALRDFPVVPGDTWESPIGVVCDLYSRRAIFVQGKHLFEGLRWYRGRECAVITSTYAIPELAIYSQAEAIRPAQQARLDGMLGPSLQVELTGGGRNRDAREGGSRGGGMRAGGRAGARGGAAGGARGGGARGGAAAGRAGQRPGTAAQLQSARLVDLQGTRRTYLTRQTGRVLHTEDTILGRVELRSASQVARNVGGKFSVELTGGGRSRAEEGGRGGRGGGGARGGMGGGRGGRGGARAGAARGGAQRAPGGRAGRAPGATGPKSIPPKLDYGFRLTTDLVVQ